MSFVTDCLERLEFKTLLKITKFCCFLNDLLSNKIRIHTKYAQKLYFCFVFQFHFSLMVAFFKEDVYENVFREQYRVPRAVIYFLETRLKDDLQHYTKRNKSISVRFQIMVYLHFIGTNVFFHVLRDCHGISTNTIYRIIHSVGEAIFNVSVLS